MGYTNYWKQPTDFTDQQWNDVKKEMAYIKEVAGGIINWTDVKDSIIIDGDTEDNTCETFVLNKYARRKKKYDGDNLAFNFCKTRELPYDLPIWHLLTFCRMIKGDFKPSRDGWSYKSEEGELDV